MQEDVIPTSIAISHLLLVSSRFGLDFRQSSILHSIKARYDAHQARIDEQGAEMVHALLETT